MHDQVMAAVEECARQPAAAARLLREIHDGSDPLLVEDVLRTLRDMPDSAGAAHLLRLIASDDQALARVADPSLMATPEAIRLAARMQAVEPNAAVRLVHLLLPDSQPAIRDPWQATRVLEIAAAVGNGIRIQTLLPCLLRHTDERVRSKAALLMGRYNHNLRWLEQRLIEPDPRVRANAVESLWGADSRNARELFQYAASDANHRVIANGLVGLHRAGELAVTREVERMAAALDPSFRAAAVWAMGESGDPRFLHRLEQVAGEQQSGRIRQNALRATIRIRKRIAELQRFGPLWVGARWRDGRLIVRVRSSDGKALAPLPPTAFVVLDQNRPLEIASVRMLGGLANGPSEQSYSVEMAGSAGPLVRVCVYGLDGMGEQDAARP